ncbi:MAG: RHS repeat-associated core domain-containing protein, partial [Planctomycetaceae bacterium]|nr:RHS repeat-associated core domain-containing protein [Planctomycetaceae bacterium]
SCYCPITYIIGLYKIAQITVTNGSRKELYFTFDGHGSTRVLTDYIGAIVEIYNYDAFGNALDFDPSTALTEFLYSGEQFDSKIGQQYLRQRYYDPTTGRFNRLDPFFGNLDDPLSLHKYVYTHADPINGIDPSGLFSVGGSLSSVAIATSISSLGANVLGGVFNTLLGGSFFPDATLSGISISFSCNITDLVANKLGDIIMTYLNHADISSLGKYFVNHLLAGESSTIYEQIRRETAPFNSQALPDIGITFSVEWVTTATDLLQATFYSVEVTSNFAVGATSYANFRYSFAGSYYRGTIWNLPTIDKYKGTFASLGVQFGVANVAGGVNAFVDFHLSGVYGITTSISIGTVPFSNLGFNGSVGITSSPYNTTAMGFQQLSRYLSDDLWYGPFLVQKAQKNFNNK